MDDEGTPYPNALTSAREATPTASKKSKGKMVVKEDENPQLAAVFKSDLTTMRTLVTCSICDQFLYEPWTIACGHTYCYSCLCSWFLTNKKKKSCPECRSRITQIPAPSFMIKQLVEVFTKRAELMPVDETVEQHTQRRAEEIAAVENDRKSEEGLFKGAFNTRNVALIRDEEDGVLRCGTCGHEHEGGRVCTHCGSYLEDEDVDYYSDELEELHEMEQDLQNENEEDIIARHLARHQPHMAPPFFFHHQHGFMFENHIHVPIDLAGQSDSDDDHTDNLSDDVEDDSDDEDTSLDGFVAPDDEPVESQPRRRRPNRAIVISDDESDIERPARGSSPIARRHSGADSSQLAPIDLTSDSEAGDASSEILRQAGWSPLDHDGDDDDIESEHDHHGERPYHYGPEFAYHYEDRDDSDTETTIGNEQEYAIGNGPQEHHPFESDWFGDVDDLATPEHSEGHESYFSFEDRHALQHNSDLSDLSSGDEDSDDELDTDQDGDTEMGASPRAFRALSELTDHSQSAGTDHDNYSDYSQDTPRGYVRGANTDSSDANHPEDLGDSHDVQEVKEEEDDDEPILPSARRHRPQPGPNINNPYRATENGHVSDRPNVFHRSENAPGGLSRAVIEHLNSPANNSRAPRDPLPALTRFWQPRGEGDSQVNTRGPPRAHSNTIRPKVEQSARQQDPLRSARAPSVTRVIASSSGRRGSRHYVSSSYHR